MINLKKPCASGQAIRFERWRNREANSFVGAGSVGDNQVSCKRVEVALLAFYGSIKRFEVDGSKYAVHTYIIYGRCDKMKERRDDENLCRASWANEL